MPSTENLARQQPSEPPKHGHQRSKSSVLKSFIHRRNNSDGTALPPADLRGPVLPEIVTCPSADEMRAPNFSKRPAALGEMPNPRVDGPRSPSKQLEFKWPPKSPTKGTFSRKTAIAEAEKMAEDEKNKNQSSLHKPKKTKSATNLTSLLSRPKSLKNLHKMVSDDGTMGRRDKENQTPSSLDTPQEESRPPIYAQFSSGALEKQAGADYLDNASDNIHRSSSDISKSSFRKQRPQSYHAQSTHSAHLKSGQGNFKPPSPTKNQRGLKVLTMGLLGSKSSDPSTEKTEPVISQQDIDKHLEAMLDRRNIPENQRYKMRNLADTIKMEFIRQDWAENNMAPSRQSTNESDSSMNGRSEMDIVKEKKSRGKSFTLSRSGKKAESSSPTKKTKGEGTLGRHFRSRSTDSVASERPSSSGSNSGSGFLSKIKAQQGPAEFVAYLRKVQKPELVEVGKLHKLRLLLRNETVAWTDEFVRQGGMEEIVGLLHRIMDVEWREEHEDALLHENLLCLKALCTTGLALQYLHSIQATLFPALLHLIFDPEKKGPSEFTTRGIITSVLFTYIQSAPNDDRIVRAKTVLGHLKDPEPKEDERPVEFVLGMRRERPYRVWCKEAVGVTKEVFWIFLHHLNVVFLPRERDQPGVTSSPQPKDSQAYMAAYFPQERPPVPAAPYVGGVEWDATNYLASHLDLLNAIVACTPTREERNKLRDLLRISGWERCMGGSLRLCKEKFYPGVHDALRTWVAAACEDGWEVKDVRYGPPPEPKSPTKNNSGKIKKKDDMPPTPKIEIPKLDFAVSAIKTDENKMDDWLS